MDPAWDAALGKAIQLAVHDPADPLDFSQPGLHGTVKFTLQDGIIEYPEIIESTGRPDLDKLLLHQVADARVPKPTGLQSDQPHEFDVELDMPTPYEEFEYSVYAAVANWRIYTKEAIIAGTQGITTVDFDYLDGVASNITIVKSSNSKELDGASAGTVSRTSLPPSPAAYASKTLHLELVFCYAINDPRPCPTAKNVILVFGTRTVTTSRIVY